ncbi:tyrosine-type recombinase/integrase [Saccharothrix sp. SC076]|nr:tyrosine-type recombinase/integrase [Saccharothrix obliqua]
MLTGWARQQVGGRGLADKTVKRRAGVVRRFMEFTNEYPWNWTAAHVDEWSADLVGVLRRSKSTIRNYHDALRSFEGYLIAPQYRWMQECEARFGTHPARICFESNTRAHLVDYEGRPERRPMTREELQRFFDYADDRVDRALRSGRKGALTAYRDATLFKVAYGWGLRCTETSKLDVTDWHRNPKAPELGKFGVLEVRYGKATRGSPPKRRTVHSVMPWAVEAVEDYVLNVRPRFGFPDQSALWVTERGGRVRPDGIEQRFAEYRDALKMPKELVPHCLRHSHVTHQIEDEADPGFVQRQVGHAYQSTTAIYTGVSDDWMNTMMRRTLDKALATDEERTR